MGQVSRATVEFNDGISLGNVKGGSNAKVGGLVGNVTGGNFTMNHSYNLGEIESQYIVGGLIGNSDISASANFNIMQSFNAGKVIDDEVGGGLIGYLKTGTITDAYNAGEIVGSGTDSKIGGLIGKSGSVTLNQVYNIGALTGTGTKGNIIGETESGSTVALNNVHYLDTVLPSDDAPIGNNLGTIKDGSTYTQNTQTEMYTPSTYANYDLDETGESQTDKVWRIYEGYRTPWLTYFMQPGIVKVFNDDRYIQYTYDGTQKTFGTERVTFYDGTGTPISNEYTNFVEATGTNIGEYFGGVYSEQLGYNFVYKKKNSTDYNPKNTATNLYAPSGITLPGNGVMLKIGDALPDSPNPGETVIPVTITVSGGARKIDGIEWTGGATDPSYTSTVDLTGIINLSAITVDNDDKAYLGIINGNNYSIAYNGVDGEGNKIYKVTLNDTSLNKTIYNITVKPGKILPYITNENNLTITADSGSRDGDNNITWNNGDWTNNIHLSDSAFLSDVPGANTLITNGNKTTVQLSNNDYSKFIDNGNGTYTIFQSQGKNTAGQYIYNKYDIKVNDGTITNPELDTSNVVINVGDAHKDLSNNVTNDNTMVSFDGGTATVLTDNHTYDGFYNLILSGNKTTATINNNTTATVLNDGYAFKNYSHNADGTYTIRVDLGIDANKIHQYKDYNVRVIDGKLTNPNIDNTNLFLKVEDAVRDISGNVTFANGTSTGTYTLKDGSGNNYTLTDTMPVYVSGGVGIVGNRTTVPITNVSATQAGNKYTWQVQPDNYNRDDYTLNVMEGRVLDPSINEIPITVNVPNGVSSNGSVTYSGDVTISGLPEGDTFGTILNISDITRNGNISTVTVNAGEGYTLTPDEDGTYRAFVAKGNDPGTGVFLYTNYIISIDPGLITAPAPPPAPAPYIPPTPVTPPEPETPPVPVVPVVPTVPTIDEPEIPEIPSTPEITEPSVPVIPDKPEIKNPDIPVVPNTPVITKPEVTEFPYITLIEEYDITDVPVVKNHEDLDNIKIMAHVQTGWYADLEHHATILLNNDDENHNGAGTSQSESDNVIIEIDAQGDTFEILGNAFSLEDQATDNEVEISGKVGGGEIPDETSSLANPTDENSEEDKPTEENSGEENSDK